MAFVHIEPVLLICHFLALPLLDTSLETVFDGIQPIKTLNCQKANQSNSPLTIKSCHIFFNRVQVSGSPRNPLEATAIA